MYKVMIVDNEPNIRSGLCYIIDWERYDFRISDLAKNGKEAIEKLEKNPPDLIITDIKMPGMDGLELIRYVREELQDENMKFIILSGYDEFDYAREAMKYNVRAYLLKPIDEKELIDSLEMIKKELVKENLYEYFYIEKVESFCEKFTEIKEFDELVNVIEKNSQDREEILEKIINNFIEIRLHPRIIKIHLDNFIMKLSTIINNMGGSIDNIIKEYSFFKTTIANINIEQLREELLDFVNDSSNYIEELKKNCGIINMVKHYIQDNYAENIRLKDLAEKFYINTAYLGQLFKKETGSSFSRYLNEIRIEKAKELLRRTDLHIYQIAEKVGYGNSDYFIIKFKEFEGCTPLEYKTKIQQS